jgi:hypothetical protein
MMRRLLQPLWILLALIFLIEAWLWDHLEPIVARVVAMIPLRAFKRWMAARVARLSPMMTLLVFAAPLVLLFPLKFLEVWLIANQYWVSAIALIVAGKFVGMGIAAFIFDVTKPKLLQMAWFVRGYDWVLDIRRRAGEIVAPTVARIKALTERIRGNSSSRLMRIVNHLRNRAFARRI